MMFSRPTTILSLLLVCALLVRSILFFGGVRGSDAYAYAYEAYNIATGQYDVQADSAYYGFRYTVLLPTAFAYALFGVSDWSSALFPLLASLGTLLLVVRLGTIFFDQRTGLLAGGLYVFCPLDLPSATLLGPSSFIPLLSGSALLACWVASDPQTQSPRQGWCYLVSGLCIGLAAQARETNLSLLGSVAALLLVRRAWSWKIAFIAVGTMTPLISEMTYYWSKTGDPLYRMTIIQQLNDLYAADVAMGSQTYFVGGPTSWAYYPLAMLGWDLGGFAWFGFFVYLALGAVGLAWYNAKMQSIVPLLLWMAPPLLYMEFGSVSLLRYVPLPKGYHYMSAISVPLVLLGAYGLHLLFNLSRMHRGPLSLSKASRSQPVGVAMIVAGLAVTSCYGSYRVLENIRNDARPFEQVASAIRAHPDRQIYVSHFRWILFLNYFLGYQTGTNYYARKPNFSEGRLHYLSHLKSLDEIPSAYIVLHDRYLYYDTVGLPIDRKTVVSDELFASLGSLRIVAEEQGQPAYNTFKVVEIERSSGSSLTHAAGG
jgi:hypothetical protein